MRSAFLLLFGLTLAVCHPAIAEAASRTAAEMISNYRLQNREGRVALDAALNKIAQEQASAMASKDVLDHGVLGPFSSRVFPHLVHRRVQCWKPARDGIMRWIGMRAWHLGQRGRCATRGGSMGGDDCRSDMTRATY